MRLSKFIIKHKMSKPYNKLKQIKNKNASVYSKMFARPVSRYDLLVFSFTKRSIFPSK